MFFFNVKSCAYHDEASGVAARRVTTYLPPRRSTIKRERETKLLVEPSKIAFIANGDTRAVMAKYEESGTPEIFKTMLNNLEVGDLIVVQSGARFNRSVCKVTEINVQPDMTSSTPIKWAFERVDMGASEKLLKAEAATISHVQKVEREAQRADLQEKLFGKNTSELQSIGLSAYGTENADSDLIEGSKFPAPE